MSIIITFITQANLKYLQEAAAILAPQNRIQGRCVGYVIVTSDFLLSIVQAYLSDNVCVNSV